MKSRLSYTTGTPLLLLALSLLFGACSVKHPSVTLGSANSLHIEAADAELEKKIFALKQALVSLATSVDEKEAERLSRHAVLYPYYLAEQYALVSPPHLHNFLINAGFKERGLCYHWALDMMAYLREQKFKSLEICRVVSLKGSLREHHGLVVTAKKQPLSEGIVLDAWRDSSQLYFGRLSEDEAYLWRKRE